MSNIVLGIIKEGKRPLDRRVPLAPQQARQVLEDYQDSALFCQSSPFRCFNDGEYKKEGISVVKDMSHCDVLLGVKEVPIADLIPGKTYFFFSHTIKKQAYNQNLLREILKKKITLIDYECLTDKNDQRLIAFGRYAGIVGTYNGILIYGRKYDLFNIRRAKDCFDLEDLQTEFSKVKLPPIKIVLTGGGRVAKGAREVLRGMNIQEVAPDDFCKQVYKKPVYVQLNSERYHYKKNGGPFDKREFYQFPERYRSDFKKYTKVTDLLIAAAYWNPKAPVLFTRADMLQIDFKVKIIADITCDIEGSIPSTKRASSVEDPVYDYDAKEDVVVAPYLKKDLVTVMAIDNLPCELPRDASTDFGKQMVNNILPSLLNGDKDGIIERATITQNGRLTEHYAYLKDYAVSL